jgi:hypothetical protein
MSRAGLDSIDRQAGQRRECAAAGFTEIALRMHDALPGLIRMTGERVLPALAGLFYTEPETCAAKLYDA